MHPAFSVIFLTTLIGAGQGLFLALMTAQTYQMIGLIKVIDDANFYGLGAAVALGLLIAGLISSVFHLGRPERAWRSATMWRTSWLSREVIALPTTMFLIFVYGMVQYFTLDSTLFTFASGFSMSTSFVVGVLAVLAIFALFICTGMIYACIKFIQEWATPLTVINYTLFGITSGFAIAALFASYVEPQLVGLFVGWALVFLVLVAITRLASLIRNSKLKLKSTPETAIGIRHSKIKQISTGAMGGSFNTREYFHGKSDFFVKLIKWIFIVLIFVASFLLLVMSLNTSNVSLLIPVVVLQYVGLIAERWFFFAQANHPQNIYYQST